MGIKVWGTELQTMMKTEKKVPSFAVFAKIILYITIFFKKFFKGNVQKMSIEGASGTIRSKEQQHFTKIFLHGVQVILKFSF